MLGPAVSIVTTESKRNTSVSADVLDTHQVTALVIDLGKQKGTPVRREAQPMQGGFM